MSQNKNRDLARELVDFLLKKENPPGESSENKEKKPEPPKATVAEFHVDIPKQGKAEPEKPVAKQAPVPQSTSSAIAQQIQTAASQPSQRPATPSQKAPVQDTKTTKSLRFPDYHKPEELKPESSQPFQSGRANTIFNEVNTLIGGAEAMRVAQARISQLEQERDLLRDESEKLLSTSESLQRKIAELKAQHEALERKFRERTEILEEEKAVLRGRLGARETELEELRREREDLQARFQNDLRKVRVRERELENRQELLRAETATLMSSKDAMILELKRQLEQLHFELENFKARSASMNAKLNEFSDRNHRTVKALRLALSMLESSDPVEDKPPKKASGS